MATFDETITAATKRGGDGVPGLVMIGGDKTGKELYSNISGYTSLSEDAIPISRDVVFKIASCTKLITSIATLQCVERGQIDLDDSVYQILPKLAGSKIISSPDQGKTLHYTATTKDITVRHLLAHSSGITYDIQHPLTTAWRASRGEKTTIADNSTVPEAFTLPLLRE